MGIEGDGEDRLLREEAGEEGNAGEGAGADGEGPEGDGHLLAQAAHLPHVLLVVHGVDDRAGSEKEEGLEEGVGGEVEHGGGPAAAADRHDHVAELGEGRVGEDPLDIVLLGGDEGGEEGGDAADPGDDIERGGGELENEEDAREHVDARRDHGGGVDEGGDGGGALHGVRQPDVERDHRRLADAAAEEEEDEGRERNAGTMESRQDVTGRRSG